LDASGGSVFSQLTLCGGGCFEIAPPRQLNRSALRIIPRNNKKEDICLIRKSL